MLLITGVWLKNLLHTKYTHIPQPKPILVPGKNRVRKIHCNNDSTKAEFLQWLIPNVSGNRDLRRVDVLLLTYEIHSNTLDVIEKFYRGKNVIIWAMSCAGQRSAAAAQLRNTFSAFVREKSKLVGGLTFKIWSFRSLMDMKCTFAHFSFPLLSKLPYNYVV